MMQSRAETSLWVSSLYVYCTHIRRCKWVARTVRRSVWVSKSRCCPAPSAGTFILPKGRTLELVIRIVQSLRPATLAVSTFLSNSLSIISRISWCWESTRHGTMLGGMPVLLSSRKQSLFTTAGRVGNLSPRWSSPGFKKRLGSQYVTTMVVRRNRFLVMRQ
jgi:hypothetical protein